MKINATAPSATQTFAAAITPTHQIKNPYDPTDQVVAAEPDPGLMAPPTPVPASTAGAPHELSTVQKLGSGLALALTIVGVAGAATPALADEPAIVQVVPSTEAPSIAQVAATDTLQAARMEPDFLKLRVDTMTSGKFDIHRETTTSTDSDGHSHTSNVTLSPWGINLGNGLFMDIHGSLDWNPYTALKGDVLPNATDIKISPSITGWSIHRDGPNVDLTSFGETGSLRDGQVTRAGLNTNIKFSQSGDTATVNPGPLSPNFNITQKGNVTTIQRFGSFQWTITREGNKVYIDHFGDGRTTIEFTPQGATLHHDVWLGQTVTAKFNGDNAIAASSSYTHGATYTWTDDRLVVDGGWGSTATYQAQ